MKRLLKEEKSKEELEQEQYVKSLNETTTHFNGVKINEPLIGRIRAAKMDDSNITTISENEKPKIPVMSSVPRPKQYARDNKGNITEVPFQADLFGWLDTIQKEARETMNRNHESDKSDKEKQKEGMTEAALRKRREFFKSYGLLPERFSSNQPAHAGL